MGKLLIGSAANRPQGSPISVLASHSGLAGDRDDRRPAALVSVIRLLRDAGLVLRSDTEEAHQYIQKAAAVLQAELDLGEPDAGKAGLALRCRLAPWQLARVTAYINENLAEAIAIETLASLARLSASYFSRAFRETVGIPPRAYVIRRRIERAQEMICKTDTPLAVIALECGLTDQAHLNKLFRRLVGTSPGAWRRQHGGGEIGECARIAA